MCLLACSMLVLVGECPENISAFHDNLEISMKCLFCGKKLKVVKNHLFIAGSNFGLNAQVRSGSTNQILFYKKSCCLGQSTSTLFLCSGGQIRAIFLFVNLNFAHLFAVLR